MICSAGPSRRRAGAQRFTPAVVTVAAAVALLGLALALPAEAKRKSSKPPKSRPVEELINPLVGPEYSTWLVGPVSWMASEKEVEQFSRLTEEEAAAAFVEAFWKARDPEPRFEANPHRETFEERYAEADKRFREAGVAGHRTDRGTVYVLYGEPEEITFEVSERPGAPPIEQWKYPKTAEEGLDERQPLRLYRFHKLGELTTFYRRTPLNARDRMLLERRRQRPPS